MKYLIVSPAAINQELPIPNMIHMQSSGVAKTTPPGKWYCPECGFGPLNAELDVGCPNCGWTGRGRRIPQTHTSNRPLSACLLVPMAFTTTPAELTIELQHNSECWASSELSALQHTESFLHNSHDGPETLSNIPYFN